jgi:hypothetical protein
MRAEELPAVARDLIANQQRAKGGRCSDHEKGDSGSPKKT